MYDRVQVKTSFDTEAKGGTVQIRGDKGAPDKLLEYLDREIAAIYMHVR